MNLIDATRKLKQDTLNLVHESDLPLREIADRAGVKFDWFVKFAYGKISAPGIDKMQPVHDFLSKSRRKRAAA